MRPFVRVTILAIAAIACASLLDGWAYVHLVQPSIYDHALGRSLRPVGYVILWMALAAALWLETRDSRRALLIGLTPAAGGALDEVLKMLLRRERPALHEGAYYFRPFGDHTFSTGNIGLPSSEALVAFAGAWMLCRLYPRAWPVWMALATGCALARVMAQAHFLSDVTVAAVVGYVLVAMIWRKFAPAVRPAS